MLFFLIGNNDFDNTKATAEAKKSFGKALPVGSSYGKKRARSESADFCEESDFVASLKGPAVHQDDRQADRQSNAVASTESPMEMCTMPKADQSVSRVLPYMWSSLVEGWRSDVPSVRAYIAQKITEVTEKKEIDVERLGRGLCKPGLDHGESTPEESKRRIQKRERIQRTKRGATERRERNEWGRTKKWWQRRTTMDTPTSPKHTDEVNDTGSSFEFRSTAVEATAFGAEEIQDGIAAGTTRNGPSGTDGRCKEPNEGPAFSSGPIGQLKKGTERVQPCQSQTASNLGRVLGDSIRAMARFCRGLPEAGPGATDKDPGGQSWGATEHRSLPRVSVSNWSFTGTQGKRDGGSQRRGRSDDYLDESGRNNGTDDATNARNEASTQCRSQRCKKAANRKGWRGGPGSKGCHWYRAAFLIGRCVSLSEIACQSPATLAWLHPVAMQKDFVTPWEAQELAADLAWECGYAATVSLRQSDVGGVRRVKNRQTTRFAKSVEIMFYEEVISGSITVPEAFLRQKDHKPWSLLPPNAEQQECKPGEEEPWTGAIQWMPNAGSLTISGEPHLLQERRREERNGAEMVDEYDEHREVTRREIENVKVISYAYRGGDRGRRILHAVREQGQWQESVRRQWMDVFGEGHTTIRSVEPQPRGDETDEIHVLIYEEELEPACILLDIKDVKTGLLHRGLQHHQRPINGYEMLEAQQIEPRRWEGAIFRRNGRIWRGADIIRHQHGWYWTILLEDEDGEGEGGDGTSLMQRSHGDNPEESFKVHLFHRRTDYRPILVKEEELVEEAINAAWNLPGHGPQAIRQLHDVLYPPNFVMEYEQVIIVELNEDESSKFQHDEVLCLLHLVFATPGEATENDEDMYRTLWTPSRASRMELLHHFRVAEQCQSRYGVRCEIKVNHVVWREQDSIVKQFENGDFIKIVVFPAAGDTAVSTREAFCRHEEHQRHRRVLIESESTESSNAGHSEEESEHTTRSRSRGRNNTDEEEEEHLNLLQVKAKKKEKGRESQKIFESHVLDRWCTRDQKASTGTSKKTILLDELIDKNNDEERPLYRSMDLTVDQRDLVKFRQACGRVSVSQQLPEEVKAELPPVAQAWYHTCDDSRGTPPRIYIYVDGSAMGGAGMEECYKSAAFAAVLFGEDAGSTRSFEGWAGGIVTTDPKGIGYKGATRADAITAERNAILLALEIVNGKIHQSSFTICFDNQAAGYGADGTWKTDKESELACKIRLITVLIQQQGGQVEFQHVKAHSNHPQNDMADILAKNINSGQVRGTVQSDEDLDITVESMNQLLLVAGAGANFPPIWDKKLMWKHDAKPAEASIDIPLAPTRDRSWTTTRAEQGHRLDLRLMSYNVLTLRPWKVDGHDPEAALLNKAALLAQQMVAQRITIAGLQETRNSQSGIFQHDGVFRVVAKGTKKGTHGCELWFNLMIPFASIAGAPLYIDPARITVVESDTTKIIVQVEIPGLTLTIGSVHAPHSGTDLESRQSWWRDLEKSIAKHRKDVLLILGDFNATLPEIIDDHVGTLVCDKSNPNSVPLQQILTGHKLWAPSTYEACHQGDRHTWTHYTGKTTRLDYILVDRNIEEGACWSYPMTDIEIGNPIEDHQAIGMDLQWEWKSHHGLKKRKGVDWIEVGKTENAHKVRSLVGSIPNCEWNVDIHDHMQFVQDAVFDVLKKEFPLKKKTSRKTYISDTTWSIRGKKMKIRAALHVMRKQSEGVAMRYVMEKLKLRETRRWDDLTAMVLAEQLLVKAQRVMSQSLKKQLRKDRDDFVEAIADDIKNAEAIDVHKALDKLKGSSKFRKRGRQQLPMLVGDEGEAQSMQERAKLWQQRCAQLEVGFFTTMEQVRSRCRTTSFQVAKNSPPPTIADIPNILELEARLRRIKRGKAPGPDQIRSEVCASATPEVAKLLFPILVKQALLLEEPIQARGGVLIPAYKGKGHHTEVESYRSLLLSNHFGKSMRGVYRPKLQPFYTKGSSSLHFAAKPGGNVSHASHYMRSFHQTAKEQGWSSSSVFVDISSAFYRIIRQFAVTVRSSKEDLARIFKVFDIPPEELDKLLHELNDRTALEEAKTTDRLQKVIGDYLEATWFTVPNNDEVVGTLAGSRPGDTFADLLFSFVFSKILDRITKAFESHGWRTSTPTSPGPSVEQLPYDRAQLPTFVQLTWADDLVILQKAEQADQLVDRTRLATGLLCDICWRHGLEPNFSAGKTEGMLHLRGKGSAAEKKKLYDKESPEVIIPSTLRRQVKLKLVSKYKHLGFMVTTGHKVRAEINARLGQMRTAYNRHKKQVYENKAIPRIKRMRILGVQVLSILRYNLGTWPLLGAKDWQCYSGAIMRMYRGIAKAETKEETLRFWTDGQVCAYLGAPSPQVLLHEARLSYFASMVRSGPDELWAVGHTNSPWYQAIEKAFEWLNYNTAGYNLEQDATYRANNWINFITKEPGQWKKWIRRARVHGIHQDAIQTHVRHWHDDYTEEAKNTGLSVPDEVYRQVDEREVEGQHACPRCKRVFRTKAAKAVHDFKKHGKVSKSRYYLHGTDCPRCHKQYHTSARLQRHFYYSKECLEYVQRRDGPLRGGIKPGINNVSADRDRALPIPVGRLIGPEEEKETQGEEAFREAQIGDSIDIDFLEAMIDILQRMEPTMPMETFDEEIQKAAQQSISDLPILLETLRTFGLEGREFPEIEEKYTDAQIKSIIRSTVEQFSLEWAICGWWDQQKSFTWRDVQIPRPRSKMITFIHLYSGHRREGDVEAHLAGFPMPDGCVLRCLSVDIIFDYDKGDLRNPTTQKAWLDFAEQGQIDGALMGPPCHTYSTARECGGIAGQSGGDGGPRVIRTAEQPYGMTQTTPREAEHLLVSNELLCFSLQFIAVIIRHLKWATLEHPADHDEGLQHIKGWRASIWKLPVVRAIAAHPRVKVAKIWQGLYGAVAPKPTTLLHTGETQFEKTIKKGATHPMPPPLVMGKSSSHEFATAQLKAYPSDLCYRLAESFVNWTYQQRNVQERTEPDRSFVQWTDALVSNFNLSRQQGQDFGRGG